MKEKKKVDEKGGGKRADGSSLEDIVHGAVGWIEREGKIFRTGDWPS